MLPWARIIEDRGGVFSDVHWYKAQTDECVYDKIVLQGVSVNPNSSSIIKNKGE